MTQHSFSGALDFIRLGGARLALLATAALAPLAHADITATWNGTAGNWTDAPRWSAGVFPNNAGGDFYDATVSAGVVTMDRDITINRFALAGGALEGGFTLGALEGLQWTSGAIRGAGGLNLGSQMPSTLAGGAAPLVLSTRIITNSGSALFSAGTVRGGSGAVINNLGGATFTILAGANFFADTANPAYTINNAGTLIARSTAGDGFSTIDAAFNNAGALRLENSGTSHTLSLAGGGVHSGAIVLPAGAVVELGGSTELQAGSSFSGDGAVFIAGDVLVTGNISGSNVAIAIGELDLGTSILQASGAASQTGGTVSLSGGTFRVGGGLGTLLMDGGTITGAGTLDAGLDAQGTIAPGIALGTLNITGAATLGEDALLSIEIGGFGAGSFDLLAIGGAASLGGALAITLANGFVPRSDDAFTILTTGTSLGGFFANAPLDGGRFDTADGRGSFAIDYTATSVLLTAYIPEPSSVLLATLSGVLLGVRRRHRKKKVRATS